MSINKLVQNLKQNNEDYEFYPTTKEIINKILNDLEGTNHKKVLDIGCGNGNFLNSLDSKKYTKYGIEKSQILINSLPEDIFILGTDFMFQNLIDKKVDVIFCNPPFSEFETWIEKIISEANCKIIYLVIPCRWKENKKILELIKKRCGFSDIIGSFDFLNSEFREARAKIDIVKIFLRSNTRLDVGESDPFDFWFNTFFKINADVEEEYVSSSSKSQEIKNQLVKGQNVIERLEELYNQDFQKLLNNYKALEHLDASILKELNINLTELKEGLKLKIEGLKCLYWTELFNNLSTITDKLTKKSREEILKTLNDNTNIDFTSGNAYNIVIWTIKNANKYFDKQLKEVYLDMSKKDNVINYKSNKKVFEFNHWRYDCENMSHYKLDYRIILRCWSNFGDYEYKNTNRLSNTTHDNINDICVVAKNLGFNVIENSKDFMWSSGEPVIFNYINKSEKDIFMTVKAYLNGNIHIKFCQEFTKALNIEASRIFKWLKTPQEISEELNLNINEVNKYLNKNLRLENKNILLLEGKKETL